MYNEKGEVHCVIFGGILYITMFFTCLLNFSLLYLDGLITTIATTFIARKHPVLYIVRKLPH